MNSWWQVHHSLDMRVRATDSAREAKVLDASARRAERTLIVLALLIAIAASSAASRVMGEGSTAPASPAAPANVQKLDDQLVEKANQLHEEAVHLFDQQEPDKAIDKEKEAETLAPQYWLPHAALGYLYYGRGGPAIREATESVKTTHPSLAEINLALMLQSFQMYDASLESFKHVLETDPQSLSAKVGIAACLIGLNEVSEGRKILDQVDASAPKDPLVLEAIARAYYDAGDMRKSKEVCQNALAVSPDPKATEKLRKLLLVTAVNTSDMNLVDALKDKVTPALQPYERGWLRAAELRFTDSARYGLSLLRFAETENNSNQQWLSYASILQQKADTAETNKTDWMQLAKNCLGNAEETEPNNVEIRIMLGSIEERLGHKQVALQKIMEGWNDAVCEPSVTQIHANNLQAKSDVTRLSKSFVKDGKGYRSYLAMLECNLPKVTCRCRYTHFREAAKQLPGVIDVIIGIDGHPTALVIFDSRKASKKSIFESQSVAALHETWEIVQEKPIETITALGDVTAKFEGPLPAPTFFGERIALQFPSPDSGTQKPPGQLLAL